MDAKKKSQFENTSQELVQNLLEIHFKKAQQRSFLFVFVSYSFYFGETKTLNHCFFLGLCFEKIKLGNIPTNPVTSELFEQQSEDEFGNGRHNCEASLGRCPTVLSPLISVKF